MSSDSTSRPQVKITRKDGSHEHLDARELKTGSTAYALSVLRDAHTGEASLECCGHPLKVKRRELTLYASALEGDDHPCGIFGLGRHAAKPVAGAATLPPQDGERISVDLEIDAPEEQLQSPMPILSFTASAGVPLKRTTLSGLITELIYRAGLHTHEPGGPARTRHPMSLIREAAAELVVNSSAAAHHLVVCVPDDPNGTAKLRDFSNGGVHRHGVELWIVVGECASINISGDGSTLVLRGLDPGIHVPQMLRDETARRFERALPRINDPRGCQVLAAASVSIEAGSLLRAHGIGLELVTDAYMPAASLNEVLMNDALASEGYSFSKPRHGGGKTEVPDQVVKAGEISVVVEVVGRTDDPYLLSLEAKDERYRRKGRPVVYWWAAFGEAISAVLSRLKEVIRNLLGR